MRATSKKNTGLFSAVTFVLFFIFNAVFIIQFDYIPGDGDSRFYMAVARQIEQSPLAKKIAPEWNGHQGIPQGHLIQDHLVGLPFTAATAAKLGLDAGHALLILNLLLMAASFYLIYRICRHSESRNRSCFIVLILLICPIAFLYRLRANHEPAVLFATVLLTWSVFFGFQRSSKYFIGLPLSFIFLILVKGFMALFLIPVSMVVAAVMSRENLGMSRPPIVIYLFVGSVSCLAGAGVCFLYEAWYHAATGESFFNTYWHVQIVRRSLSDPATSLPFVVAKLRNIIFYIGCVIWYIIPTILLILASWWRNRHWNRLNRSQCTLIAAGVCWILLACVSDRITMRYIFPSYFLIGAGLAANALQGFPQVLKKWDLLINKTATPLLVIGAWGVLTLFYGLLT